MPASQIAYQISGRFSRSAMRPASRLPSASPAMYAVSTLDSASSVVPNTYTSIRLHTTSSTSAVKPLKKKARVTRRDMGR